MRTPLTLDNPYGIDAAFLGRARKLVSAEALLTPMRPSRVLSQHCGREVYFKCETEQWTGSFKVRGALACLSALEGEARKKGVITSSVGNHGLGIAWACRRLGIPGLVVIPSSVPKAKRVTLAEMMIKVREAGGTYDAAEAYARNLAEEADATFVSPYDDPWVIAGNGGTVGMEILEQLPNVGAVVLPVGGGGLASGVGLVLGDRMPILGVNPAASPAMARALEAGVVAERYDSQPTLAEGLVGGVSANTAAYCRRYLTGVTVVEEQAIAEAVAFMAQKERIVVEGSAAAAVAEVLRGDDLPGTGPICLVLTGRNIDSARFRQLVGPPAG